MTGTEVLVRTLVGHDAIMFDLDGTVYDQEDFDYPAFVEVAGRVLGTNGPAARSLGRWLLEHKRAVGKGYGRLFDDMLEWTGVTGWDVRELVAMYHAHDARGLSPRRSLAGLMRRLREQGSTLYVVTNGRRSTQMRKLQRLGLHGVVEGIHIGDPSEPGCPLKPSPEACPWRSAVPARIPSVMVGDDDAVDGGFARALGVTYVAFRYR